MLGPWLPQRQAWAETQPTWAQSTDGTLQGSGGVGGSRGLGQAGGGGWGAGHAPSPCLSLRRRTWSLPWAPSLLTPRGGPGAAYALAALLPRPGGAAPGARHVGSPALQPARTHGHGWPAALGESPQDSESKHHHQKTPPATDTQACLLKVDGRPHCTRTLERSGSCSPRCRCGGQGARGWGCGWARPCDSAVGSHGMAPWRSTAVRHCL